MAFGQDFLKSFFGNDYVKDYRHASKTFRSNGYENSPRFKFLFHVYFNINTTEIPQLRNIFSTPDTSTIGLLVKTIDLPRFQIDVETMNQYNRKRIVQKKIEYQPISVKFHDDGGDLIRNLWYNYFSYYYKDPSQQYRGQTNTNGSIGPSATATTGFDYNSRDIYSSNRLVSDWGYIGESYYDNTSSAGGKPAFFKDITIYGFDQHKFVQYTLINPLISQWNHDTYDYYQGDGIMENTVTINYETVKYYSGAIGAARPDTNVQGFADPNYYDTEPSPLSRPGGTRSIIGQGGLLDAGIGIISDLQSGTVGGVIGAVQKAGVAYNTFKGAKLGQVFKEEALGQIKGILTSTNQGLPGPANINNIIRSPITNVLNRPLFPTPSFNGSTTARPTTNTNSVIGAISNFIPPLR